jgi:F0F1-type ATP synthase membrane subunit c/vacuolar-type H+-ATPase subunit K
MLLAAAQKVGIELSTSGLAGLGIGIVFGSLLVASALTLFIRDDLFRVAMLGFALTEAIALFTLMVTFLVLFVWLFLFIVIPENTIESINSIQLFACFATIEDTVIQIKNLVAKTPLFQQDKEKLLSLLDDLEKVDDKVSQLNIIFTLFETVEARYRLVMGRHVLATKQEVENIKELLDATRLTEEDSVFLYKLFSEIKTQSHILEIQALLYQAKKHFF